MGDKLFKTRASRSITAVLAIIGFISVLSMGFLLVANPNSLGSMAELVMLVKQDSLYPLKTEPAVQGAMAGLVASLGDPYSQYLNPKEFEEMNIRVQGTFGGIGVVVGADEDGKIKVISPIKGTPAERAGLKTGDIIFAVNGESTRNLSTDKVVEMMRGEPGTELRLVVLRGQEEKSFRIIRQIINVPSVEWKMLETTPAAGYIRLNQFNSHSDREMSEALKAISEHKAQSIVLDLRDNPGGDLNVAVNIADMFMEDGAIVIIQDAKGNKRTYEAKPGSVKLPMVVLINEGSASASEILSGALKDHRLAQLVGEKSFGKGLVQTIFPLRGGDALKLTTDKYLTPAGTDINKIGIQPDFVVKDTTEGKDLQLNRALELLSKTSM
ncbi:MAG: S41 family peptidase [Methylocystaceae bacterium]